MCITFVTVVNFLEDTMINSQLDSVMGSDVLSVRVWVRPNTWAGKDVIV
jgi:hypothetical protein